jgi:DNA mismatch endonuclease (patch repair protein)
MGRKKKEYLRDGRSPVPLKEATSRVMSANKAKNTKPELALRRNLWKRDLKGYRIHPKHIPGRPDIVYSRKKLAIFVHGCFWHRCPTCNKPLPKSNTEFWSTKFEKNVERDKRKKQLLENEGWKVLTIWECEIKSELSKILDKIEGVLK